MNMTLRKNAQYMVALAGATLMLSACGAPEDYMFDAIKSKGYIPYVNPMASAGVGTIIKGSPNSLSVAANPQTCFPDEHQGAKTNLRWVSDTDLPSLNENVSFGFNAKLSSLLVMGTPLVGLNLGFEKATKVDLKFSGAQIELMDEIRFLEYYSKASDTCKHYFKNFPFIRQALKVNAMSFTFYQSNGAVIELQPEMIADIVNIGFGVNWKIEKGMTLVINSPKYIGYQVVKLDTSETAPGLLRWQSNRVSSNAFVWEEVYNSTVNALAFANLMPAEPLPAQPIGLKLK